jgi:hypothetical protein
MGRIEKTVFVSYRRADIAWAVAVVGDLTHNGYDVFIDYDGIASGSFESVILENIRARAHFLVLLTPTALERCGDPKDWMRREIEAALDSKRTIEPLMLAGFDFGRPAIASQLTDKLAALKEYNGLPVPESYFAQAMERLRNKFLSVSLDTVLHPASDSAQQVAKEQKDKTVAAFALVEDYARAALKHKEELGPSFAGLLKLKEELGPSFAGLLKLKEELGPQLEGHSTVLRSNSDPQVLRRTRDATIEKYPDLTKKSNE